MDWPSVNTEAVSGLKPLPIGVKLIVDATERARFYSSTPKSTAAAILVPGSHKKTQKGDWNQPQNNATEEGFDHLVAPG